MMMSRCASTARSVATIAALLALAAARAAAQDAAPDSDRGWPREIDTDTAQILIYQPQPDQLRGITLTGRAAVGVTAKGATEPVFGVLWFTARAQADRDERTVAIDQVAVTDVRFTGITDEQEEQFKQLVDPTLRKWAFTIALDRLEATLADAAVERRSADNLNTTPPAIIFSPVPAALLLYSGDPVPQPTSDAGIQRVVNTPMFVVFDSVANAYYLNGGPLWYAAKNALGPWKKIARPPARVAALVPDSIQRAGTPPGEPPKIIVATEPTELIVTAGAPSWVPIAGTDLLYVSNTERDVFKDLRSQRTYVLLAGRWFSAPSSTGPWMFVYPAALPVAFQKIPPGSPKANVLVSVPGTVQSTDAALDAQIPQTAAIDRRIAKLTVVYDGNPQFQAIPGTSVQYAVNTPTQVLKIGARYYACDEAVWFTSIGPRGPWAVSDFVPRAVDSIPPSAPVYNVRFVEVYQATPTLVYVGYTPGYLWAFPYYGTMVYGTGYYYAPYVSAVVYYPRPVTFGFALRYNPWTGWTVGFGYTTPFMHVGVAVGGPRYGGWYGPYGRPPYPPPYYRPPYRGYPGYRAPSVGYRSMPPGSRAPAGGPRATLYTASNNLYRQRANKNRVAPVPSVTRDLGSARGQTSTGRPNDVLAGQDGSVYRKNGNAWQTNDGATWKDAGSGGAASAHPSAPPAARPSAPPGRRPSTPTAAHSSTGPTSHSSTPPATTSGTPPATGGAVPSDVNRDMQARQHGQQRTQAYTRATTGATQPMPRAPARTASRPASAPRPTTPAMPRASGARKP